MCIDPLTMGLVGAGVSAASGLMASQQQAAAYRSQAEFQKRQANLTAQKGAFDANLSARRADRQLSGIRGQYLSSGIALDGSAAEVIADSATNASLDEQAIKFGANVEASNLNFSSALSRANAKSASQAGYVGALSSGINAFSSYNTGMQNRTMLQNPYTQYRMAQRGVASGLF